MTQSGRPEPSANRPAPHRQESTPSPKRTFASGDYRLSELARTSKQMLGPDRQRDDPRDNGRGVAILHPIQKSSTTMDTNGTWRFSETDGTNGQSENSGVEYIKRRPPQQCRGRPALKEAGSSKGDLMPTSLYELSVPTFLQTVKAARSFLDRAAGHCAETRADPNDFVHVRLFDDMAPFHFQIEAAWHHSVWGLEAVKTGVFAPPALVGPVPFAALQAMIGKAETALETFTPDEVNSWAGKDLDLQIGPRRLAFTSETFILSFSLPNFYFHIVTAYDILRTRGVPLGKRDYEGRLRTRPA
jgi:uncharacterized protein